MSIITLTTDFGLADSYVGAMKGVILRIAPQAQLVDITHQAPPQDVRAAMAILQGVVPYFPATAVHLVVVDPGVGSRRRPIAIRTEQGVFVGPDNGVFTPVIAAAGDSSIAVLHLDNPAFWLPTISHTFHGRDLFAPVAAHLAAGTPFEAVGAPIHDPVLLPLSAPRRQAGGRIRGQVVYVDHFGNLISDVPAEWLAGRSWQFYIAGRRVDGLSQTYAAVEPGQLLALIGSSGQLEVAVRNGSAAQQLGVSAGEPIEADTHDIMRNA